MKFLFSTFLILCFALSSAQSLTPEVVSTAGSTLSDGTHSLTWTLGEPLTSTLSTTNTLTQGFQQGAINITAIAVETKNVITINVYPNPAIDIVQLQFSERVKNCFISIYSNDGKLMYSDKILENSSYKLNLGALPSGTYSLKLSGGIIAHYQVVKLN